MRLLYRFSGPITNKVIHSQVVGTLEALRLQGVDVDLGAWSGLGHYLRHSSDCRAAAAELRRRLQAPFHIHLTVDRLKSLDQWRKARELSQAAQSGPGIILQTRSHDLAILMAELRRERPQLRFVYELRGDVRAESDFLHGSNPRPELLAVEAKMGQTLTSADLVLCVSQALAVRVQERYNLCPERLHVMPCTADEQRFHPDALEREHRRAELGLSREDFLLVYSGSLRKGWDVPERIFEFLRVQLEGCPELQVLLLSPDQPAAAELMRRLPAGHVQFRSCGHWEMQSWLCAGDAGLLLREAHPLNEVASPTKAAEMLLCGLPLIISPGVGDYSAWVAANGLGVVVDGQTPQTLDWDALRVQDPWVLHHQARQQVARTDHARRLADRLRSL
jgi:hypothetical protein